MYGEGSNVIQGVVYFVENLILRFGVDFEEEGPFERRIDLEHPDLPMPAFEIAHHIPSRAPSGRT